MTHLNTALLALEMKARAVQEEFARDGAVLARVDESLARQDRARMNQRLQVATTKAKDEVMATRDALWLLEQIDGLLGDGDYHKGDDANHDDPRSRHDVQPLPPHPPIPRPQFSSSSSSSSSLHRPRPRINSLVNRLYSPSPRTHGHHHHGHKHCLEPYSPATTPRGSARRTTSAGRVRPSSNSISRYPQSTSSFTSPSSSSSSSSSAASSQSMAVGQCSVHGIPSRPTTATPNAALPSKGGKGGNRVYDLKQRQQDEQANKTAAKHLNEASKLIRRLMQETTSHTERQPVR